MTNPRFAIAGRDPREESYAVTTAATGDEGLTLVRDAAYDVVLLDIWLPDRDGLEVLKEINALEAKPEVIIISGHGTIETAVRATKLGAFDFLEKPLSLDRTLILVKNAIDARRLRHENQEFHRQLNANTSITGESVPIKALRQQIKLMAPTNGRVLIFGESGCGKELIARAIHASSPRRDRVFIELNCAAIPEDFIESELFGYRHGAVPGEAPEKRGTFERADGGTLFLDEVGDMSLKMQAKVLRALDEGRFTPVGATSPVQVDVRVIAATNKDLEEEIARGNFREDFFYRLNVIPFFRSAVAGAEGRHSVAGARIPARVWPRVWASADRDRRRGDCGAQAISLAGKCSRAEECDRASADSESSGAADRAAASADAGLSRRRRRARSSRLCIRRVRLMSGITF